MIIDENHPALSGHSDYDELQNSKILLIEVDKAIAVLLSGGSQSYTVDTGQTQLAVTKNDIGKLNTMREGLISRIEYYENKLGIGKGPGMTRVVPLW
ncbi:MAG: hypothetical protein LBJ31_04300 [Treponema sp.]|jgi:hypothetical protein|nr:hypothetical protein [Treponema sp.]